MTTNDRRDIKADYKTAYIAEYEAHKRAGNDVRAADVASILREHYGHEVAPREESTPRKQAAKKATGKAPERADSKAPQNTAEPKPRHTKGASDA